MGEFEFSAVFQSGSQEDVLDFCRPAASAALDGLDSCVIAYGQTGAGKTYTMYGPGEASLHGVVPRFAQELFTSDSTTGVGISMLELQSTERLLDLLGEGLPAEVKVKYNHGANISLENATEVQCSNSDELMTCIFQSLHKRTVATTMMGATSSRSHLLAVFNVKSSNVTTGELLTGRVVMVDSAGSERPSRATAAGDTLREARRGRTLESLIAVLNAYTRGAK